MRLEINPYIKFAARANKYNWSELTIGFNGYQVVIFTTGTKSGKFNFGVCLEKPNGNTYHSLTRMDGWN